MLYWETKVNKKTKSCQEQVDLKNLQEAGSGCFIDLIEYGHFYLDAVNNYTIYPNQSTGLHLPNHQITAIHHSTHFY